MSKTSDERYTPQEILDAVAAFWPEGIDLDPCWAPGSLVKARTCWTTEDDGLEQDWSPHKTIWVNPPFSNVGPWARECAVNGSSHRAIINEILLLTRIDFTTAWSRWLWDADAWLLRSSRDRFVVDGGQQLGTPTFGCVVAYWGPRVRRFERVFAADFELGGVVLL